MSTIFTDRKEVFGKWFRSYPNNWFENAVLEYYERLQNHVKEDIDTLFVEIGSEHMSQRLNDFIDKDRQGQEDTYCACIENNRIHTIEKLKWLISEHSQPPEIEVEKNDKPISWKWQRELELERLADNTNDSLAFKWEYQTENAPVVYTVTDRCWYEADLHYWSNCFSKRLKKRLKRIGKSS